MCYRNRTALSNLPFEQGDYRTVRTEHVSEPDRGEYRVGFLGEVLDDHLAHTLGGAHHRRRVHRLVSRDEDEPVNTELV